VAGSQAQWSLCVAMYGTQPHVVHAKAGLELWPINCQILLCKDIKDQQLKHLVSLLLCACVMNGCMVHTRVFVCVCVCVCARVCVCVCTRLCAVQGSVWECKEAIVYMSQGAHSCDWVGPCHVTACSFLAFDAGFSHMIRFVIRVVMRYVFE